MTLYKQLYTIPLEICCSVLLSLLTTIKQGSENIITIPNTQCTRHKERKGIDFASHNINNKVEVEQKAI